MAKPNKPATPFEGFPLQPSWSGRHWHWAKKIKGRRRYFGRCDRGWEPALAKFDAQKADLYAGREPRESTGNVTVANLLNRFLSQKHVAKESGELAPRTYDDYVFTCELISTQFGNSTLVESLRDVEFDDLRNSLSSRFGPSRLSRELQQARTIFKFACKLTGKNIDYADSLHPPKVRDIRVAIRSHGSLIFDPSEVRSMIDAANPTLATMILLGINCGFGNADCGKLKLTDVDLTAGWHDVARGKTGLPRRAKLWPETIAALEHYLTNVRAEPKSKDHKGLIFITKHGGSYFKDTRNNPIAKSFRVLAMRLDLHQRQRGFYSLRRTFRTEAAATLDFEAVNYMSGWVDSSIAARYTRKISDERLSHVADFMREWLGGATNGVTQETDRDIIPMVQ